MEKITNWHDVVYQWHQDALRQLKRHTGTEPVEILDLRLASKANEVALVYLGLRKVYNEGGFNIERSPLIVLQHQRSKIASEIMSYHRPQSEKNDADARYNRLTSLQQRFMKLAKQNLSKEAFAELKKEQRVIRTHKQYNTFDGWCERTGKRKRLFKESTR
jgi:hypothetical protein